MMVFKCLLLYFGACSAEKVLETYMNQQTNITDDSLSFERINGSSSYNFDKYISLNQTFNKKSSVSNRTLKKYFQHKGKSPKFLRFPQKRRPSKPKIQEKQFFLPRPRPILPFRLNPAAFLIPAIPTLVGKVNF